MNWPSGLLWGFRGDRRSHDDHGDEPGHAAFVLTAGMRIVPGLHPRMASESQGPTLMRQLEPPGFLALNYGARTPITVIVAHIVFGSILGAFYQTA
jgi:hypothetical protein